ncbi:zinc finger protein 595-like [Penaeus indicus]|uniref:zinc finger protein 595-like n=1 Tax=Penaeus indicus TaxID=29960 RepID=UPI00300CFE3B
MESLPTEDNPIQEVYIKEEIPDDIKIEIKDEEESLDGSAPSGDHMEGACATHKSEKLDTTPIAAEEQEKVDISSDEENRSSNLTISDSYLGSCYSEGNFSCSTSCRHCGDGLPTQAALYAHISTAHPEELHNYHCCPVCPALVSSRPSLLRHFGRSHPGAKPPGHDAEHCEKCGAVFRSYTALRKHLKENHPESLLHTCKKCGSTFKYSYLLARHTKSAHRERVVPPPNNCHKCDICGREYRIRSRLEKHVKMVHTNPEARVFRCTTCNLTFASNNHRVQHYRAVHRKRKQPHCNECAKSFETVDELSVHRQEHKIDCPVCNKTFVRRDTLREHLLIHNGPRLPCPYCSKTFTQNSNLKRHIRIHTGEKPYKCTFCSKCFGDKSACNSHIRVHTGAERCMCHICGASFSKRQKLTYHMRKHTGEGLLHCPLCTKPTTNSYALKKHMETHQQPLMKVLSSIGIASMIEDFSETTLTALRNLAQLATQRSTEFASKQKINKQGSTSKDTSIQGSNTYKEDIESSVVAQQESSTDHIANCMAEAENTEIDSKELKAEECNKNDNMQSSDTIKVDDHERYLLKDYSKGGDNSLEINNSDELLPEKSIVLTEKMEERKTESKKNSFVDSDKEQLESAKNEGSAVAAQEQTFGSLILQGTPAVVLMQLIENIVESHFGSFHAEEVRPTLGDQLVEQCLEVMMHDDTSRSSDDGKSGDACAESSSVHDLSLNTDEQKISRANNNSNNKEKIDAYTADTWLDSNTHMDDNFLSGESESDFYVYTDNTDFCDTRSKNNIKKEKYDKYDRTTDNKEMGLFQREVLGDDSYVFSTSKASGTSTEIVPIYTETRLSHEDVIL